MKLRAKRRAAERKLRNLADKTSQTTGSSGPLQAQAAASGQTTPSSISQMPIIQNDADSEQPPSRLDPAPPRPVPSHLLNPFEESDVEVAEYHARQQARMSAKIAQFVAQNHTRQGTRIAEAMNRTADNPAVTNNSPQLDPTHFSEPQPEKHISAEQLAANRANAQHSTGAITPEGKARSARNNFRHGLTHTEGDLLLLADESADDYSLALADFQQEWQPATATEHDLVERLASRQWLRRRAMRLQKLYLASDGRILDYDHYSLYRRYETAHERSYNKALADLIRVRNQHSREQNGFESQQRKQKEHLFRLRTLQNREKLQEFALRTSEAKARLAEAKLQRALDDTSSPQPAKSPHPWLENQPLNQ